VHQKKNFMDIFLRIKHIVVYYIDGSSGYIPGYITLKYDMVMQRVSYKNVYKLQKCFVIT